MCMCSADDFDSDRGCCTLGATHRNDAGRLRTTLLHDETTDELLKMHFSGGAVLLHSLYIRWQRLVGDVPRGLVRLLERDDVQLVMCC
uniref:Uncharacterized protein n=1 Tax=Pfiesteria piscicida TaxID=71001 RepID=A3E3N5_PFIPI|nr:unknown [Pfiesteria piscicida]